ncbi:MAG TPA: hypothetical protein VFE08_04130, partial [Candidatus Sulfotelmatobacter sp.]|nr:hypothetical protein [Candidatus Sulfotelmatobacter sp.]
PGVFRVRISNGAEQRVADLKGFRHTGAFTLWMGLDPTDTPMLIRDVGTDDILRPHTGTEIKVSDNGSPSPLVSYATRHEGTATCCC